MIENSLTISGTSPGQFERALRAGRFAVVMEQKPPASADVSAFVESVLPLRDYCDTVILTDNPLATVHVANIAPASLLVQHGFDMMCGVTSRDRNRIAQQGYLLALAALGVRNIFCPTGDHPRYGDHPDATPVYETNSIRLLQLARKMRDQGTLDSGRPLETAPHFLLGGTAAPDSPPVGDRPADALRKVEAGADFFLSQPVFDIAAFRVYMARLRDLGVTERAHFIAGIAPLPSLEMAALVRATPDIAIPDAVIDRLCGVLPHDRDREGLRIAADHIAEIRAIDGVRGVLLYPLDHPAERLIALAEMAGLPKPV